jgi:hypothetical protein
VAGESGTVAATSATGPGAVAPSANQEAPTKFKLASEHLGPGTGVADTRLAGVAILAALFGLAGFGLVFRGFARRQGLGHRW